MMSFQKGSSGFFTGNQKKITNTHFKGKCARQSTLTKPLKEAWKILRRKRRKKGESSSPYRIFRQDLIPQQVHPIAPFGEKKK